MSALRSYTRALRPVPEGEWPNREMIGRIPAGRLPLEVWLSRDYLLMVYREGAYQRLSVVRVMTDPTGRFAGSIPWEDLQRLKRECGRGDSWAVEVYPADADVVNIQNMRHLFLLPEPPAYGWREGARSGSDGQQAEG